LRAERTRRVARKDSFDLRGSRPTWLPLAEAGPDRLHPAGGAGDYAELDGGDRYSLSRPALPQPASSGIDFIVLVTMGNRSFDHFLSWVPGAEGMPANQQFKDASGAVQTPFRLSANPSYGYQACAWQDPNHSYQGGRTQLASGAMNGWL
jgi:phospholipase C